MRITITPHMTHTHSFSLSLSLSIYIYIYIRKHVSVVFRSHINELRRFLASHFIRLNKIVTVILWNIILHLLIPVDVIVIKWASSISLASYNHVTYTENKKQFFPLARMALGRVELRSWFTSTGSYRKQKRISNLEYSNTKHWSFKIWVWVSCGNTIGKIGCVAHNTQNIITYMEAETKLNILQVSHLPNYWRLARRYNDLFIYSTSPLRNVETWSIFKHIKVELLSPRPVQISLLINKILEHFHIFLAFCF